MQFYKLFVSGFFLISLNCIKCCYSEILLNEDLLLTSKKAEFKTSLWMKSLLFALTLDGTLNAINRTSGQILWKLPGDPLLNIQSDYKNGPIFVANPSDGSLYLFKLEKDGLKKLPFTIPDLVALSPCRSTDGLLYTGVKKDTWYAVDALSGKQLYVLSMERQNPFCPQIIPSTIFLGKTKYSITMFDVASRKVKWNATYIDYSVRPSDPSNYDMQHFASNSNGLLVTLERNKNEITWTQDFSSPVIGVYSVDVDGSLFRSSFQNVAIDTLQLLTLNNFSSNDWYALFHQHAFVDPILQSVLFIGRHDSKLYALSSLVEMSTVNVAPKYFGRMLLDAPKSPLTADVANQQTNKPSNDGTFNSQTIILGHHEVPDMLSTNMLVFTPPFSPKLIEDQSNLGVITLPSSSTKSPNHDFSEINFILIGATTVITLVLSALYIQLMVSKKKEIVFLAKDGTYNVGKISFNMIHVIGQGCGGTFVYKGRFEGRNVAVKRLLVSCIAIAEHEVNLLKESDHHQNVIRYYCTERDSQFQYIALELCCATLFDLVHGDKLLDDVDADENVKFRQLEDCVTPLITLNEMFKNLNLIDLLAQTTDGLAHLHSLDIVHRDMKPQNVLLSMPDKSGHIRAMISDFGLCKKLSEGRNSFSSHGVNGPSEVGTSGWIAPELVNKDLGTATKAVDIFSLGCIFFYVLTMGGHPFGEPLHRQSNISQNNTNFDQLNGKDSNICLHLIKSMVNPLIEKRPSVQRVRKHAMFWSCDKQLRYFEIVSNRLEKLPDDDVHVLRLESNGLRAIKFDWISNISDDFKLDLKKYRNYSKHSVRDLLRAIRNKHHHYSELPVSLQASLGRIPDEYIRYFTDRFPTLLTHVYDAMRICDHEHLFTEFY